MAPKRGVAARALLQSGLALDRGTGVITVRVEAGRVVIAFDHRDARPRLEHPREIAEGKHRITQMLEDEAHEHVIKGRRAIGERVEVSNLKTHRVEKVRFICPRARNGNRLRVNVYGGNANAWRALQQDGRLG
ncbi:MAG: hypothetical protein AAFX85_11235, partial [Pseudomonadota bacterium]